MNSLSFRLYLYSGQLRPHPISGCPISNHLPLIFLGVCCTISYSQSPQDRGYWNEQTFFSIRHDDKDDDGDKISTRVTEACSRMNEKSSDWQVVWGKIPPSFIKSYPHVDKALSLYSSRDKLDRWPGILTNIQEWGRRLEATEEIETCNNIKRWDLGVQQRPSVVGFTDPKIWQERFETEYSGLKKGEMVIKCRDYGVKLRIEI